MARTGPFKTLARRAYATLLAMSVGAIAAGCVTTQWVPVTQAPRMGNEVQLKVQVPSDSASTTTRKMTLYYPRMEGDSVVVGTPVQYDRTMRWSTRVRAASALVRVQHFNVLGTVGALAGIAVAAYKMGMGWRANP